MEGPKLKSDEFPPVGSYRARAVTLIYVDLVNNERGPGEGI